MSVRRLYGSLRRRATSEGVCGPAARLARCWGLRAFFSVVVIGRSVDHLFPFGKAE